jgi:antitoxin PrlF
MEPGMQSTLTSKGQATIPKEVREYLGIKPGDTVKFFFGAKGQVYMLPTIPISAVSGILYRPGQRTISIKEMNEGIAQAAFEADERTKSPEARRGAKAARRRAK